MKNIRKYMLALTLLTSLSASSQTTLLYESFNGYNYQAPEGAEPFSVYSNQGFLSDTEDLDKPEIAKWNEGILGDPCNASIANKCIEVGTASLQQEFKIYLDYNYKGNITVSFSMAPHSKIKSKSYKICPYVTMISDDGNPVLPIKKYINGKEVESLSKSELDFDKWNIISLEYENAANHTLAIGSCHRDKNGKLLRTDDNRFFLDEIKITSDQVPEDRTYSESSQNNNLSNTSHANITLARTISRNHWNSFCVPFDIPTGIIDNVFGENIQIMKIDTVTNDNIIFTKTKRIYAGIPYLIKTDKDIVNPVFEGVNIKDPQSKDLHFNGYHFIGNFNKTEITDNNIYVLGTDNKIYHAKKGSFINSFHAYFTSNKGEDSFSAKFNIADVVSAINAIQGISGNSSDSNYYNILGKRINAPQKGLFIHNGKVIVK